MPRTFSADRHEAGRDDLADVGHRREVDDGVAVLDQPVERVGVEDVADEAVDPSAT